MKRFLPLLLLAVATFAAYAPVLRNGIVWDDTALLLRDPLIRSWRLIPEGFQHFLFTDATASDFYRPVQRLSYTLEYAAYGVKPLGYHITNVLIHVGAAVALFFLGEELLRLFAAEKPRRFVAFTAALIWAVHPVHSGAVAYISGRADSLAAMFGFTGLTLALVSLRKQRSHDWWWNVGAGACFLLSCLSKEAGGIFLAAWLLLLALRHDWKNAGRAIVIILFVVTSYLSLRLPAEHIPAPVIREPPPLLVRPILAARAFAEYAYLTFLPLNLHMERDVETHPTGVNPESVSQASWRELETLAGLLLLGGFFYWLWRERQRDRAVFACLLLTLLTYLPVSGIVLLNANIAEHWLYLPTAFFFLALSLTANRLLSSAAFSRAGSFAFMLVAAAWILFLGGRSFVRAFDWKDQRTFFERSIAAGGDSARMLINLAGVEMNEGQLVEAKAHLERALQKAPNHPLAVINLAAVAVKQGDFQSAHEWLKRATEMPVVAAQAHELLAVLANREKGDVDLLRLRLATRTGAPDWLIEKRYIKVLFDSGATAAALAELQQVLQTQWYRAESWQLLSQLLAKSGRGQEANLALKRAHRYDVRLDARPKVL